MVAKPSIAAADDHSLTAASVQDRTIVLTRIFDAPRELVFQVWTEPRHLARWFGPRDYSAPDVAADVRVGGRWRICIRAPDGAAYWMHGVYREIVPPERLVFTHVWEQGHSAAAQQTLVSLVFEDVGGKTRMTFHKAVLVSSAEQVAQRGGWSECFDRLGAYLRSMPVTNQLQENS